MDGIKLSDTMKSIFSRIIEYDSSIDRNKKVDLWVDAFGEDIVQFSSSLKDNDNSNRVISIKRKIRCDLDQKTQAAFKEYLRCSFPDITYLYDAGTLNLDLIGEVLKGEDYYELIKGGLFSLDEATKKAIEFVEK